MLNRRNFIKKTSILGLTSLLYPSFSSASSISNIKKGQTITQENIKSVRPGYSLEPKYYYSILGKKALRDLKFGDRITLDDFS